MSFILFCIVLSTFIPRGGGVFLNSGSLPTTANSWATPALSQADIYSIVKGRYQSFLSFFKVFGGEDITMTDSWTETSPSQLLHTFIIVRRSLWFAAVL